MDYETVTAEAFGGSLRGIGLNVLVRDVIEQVAFLEDIFQLRAHRVNQDFAILTYFGEVMQLHADHTYGANPLLGLLPEAGARGAHILQEPTDKPHGLREAYILCDNGYAWVPSRPLDLE